MSLSFSSPFLHIQEPEDDDEEEGGQQSNIKNSILRQVADSWPSVKARLVTLSEEISAATTRGVSTFIVTTHHPTTNGGPHKIDVATQRYFLAKLFGLIAHMAQCSGDFIAERFRNDVWPMAADQLGTALQSKEELRSNHRSGRVRQLKGQEDQKRSNNAENTLSISGHVDEPGRRWSESERALIFAILESLNTAIGNEECGRALYTILSPIGSVLLPFLGVDDAQISDLVMEIIKKILSIDCDVMLRSLLELSGQGLPRPPLSLRRKEPRNKLALFQPSDRLSDSNSLIALDGYRNNDHSWKSRISKRCNECLVFIETLPEQPLL